MHWNDDGLDMEKGQIQTRTRVRHRNLGKPVRRKNIDKRSLPTPSEESSKDKEMSTRIRRQSGVRVLSSTRREVGFRKRERRNKRKTLE